MRTTRTALIILVLASIAFAGMLSQVKITITGNGEGIYLLRGTSGRLLEIKDDLFLNEGKRYLAGIDLVDIKHGVSDVRRRPPPGPHLYYEWNERTGEGYVRNYFGDGRQMLTCFGRYLDDNNRGIDGLFVGGGLPPNVRADDMTSKNETGMAYYDGRRWFHIWCNVNEAVFSPGSFTPVTPSAWNFLGSRVLHDEPQGLVLTSSHEIVISSVPVRIDRYAHFRAGETYFILAIDFRNTGNTPVTFSYLYADEPWLGNYGTSAGNVGWTSDGLQQHTGRLPRGRHRYAGFFDWGNDAVNEGHHFTGVANFIEWFGNETPLVYFANGPHDIPQKDGVGPPLSGDARYLGVLFGPRRLEPQETVRYTFAIGMAGHTVENGFPVKPLIDLVAFP